MLTRPAYASVVAEMGHTAPAYAYAASNPVGLVDADGLDTFMCIAPLHALGGANASPGNTKSGPDWNMNPLHHQYICTQKKGEKPQCGGQDRSGNPLGSYGTASAGDTFIPQRCSWTDDPNKCLEDCIVSAINGGRPIYSLFNAGGGQNCQKWSEEVLASCRAACGITKP